MLADRDKLKSLGLGRFSKDFDNVESQYLNLVYDPVFDRVVERWVYDKTAGLMEWKCAICGELAATRGCFPPAAIWPGSAGRCWTGRSWAGNP